MFNTRGIILTIFLGVKDLGFPILSLPGKMLSFIKEDPEEEEGEGGVIGLAALGIGVTVLLLLLVFFWGEVAGSMLP